MKSIDIYGNNQYEQFTKVREACRMVYSWWRLRK